MKAGAVVGVGRGPGSPSVFSGHRLFIIGSRRGREEGGFVPHLCWRTWRWPQQDPVTKGSLIGSEHAGDWAASQWRYHTMPGNPQNPDSSASHWLFLQDPASIILEAWHNSGILCTCRSIKTTSLLNFFEVHVGLVVQGQNRKYPN